jgi:hypothetical protein
LTFGGPWEVSNGPFYGAVCDDVYVTPRTVETLLRFRDFPCYPTSFRSCIRMAVCFIRARIGEEFVEPWLVAKCSKAKADAVIL